jgi:hypothetical protein
LEKLYFQHNANYRYQIIAGLDKPDCPGQVNIIVGQALLEKVVAQSGKWIFLRSYQIEGKPPCHYKWVLLLYWSAEFQTTVGQAFLKKQFRVDILTIISIESISCRATLLLLS